MQEFKETTVTAYDVLGIDVNADQKTIHAALRKLALDWHPDRVPTWRRAEATLRFQAVMDAYAKIRTPEVRKLYDDSLRKTGKVKRRRFATSNDNMPLALKAKAWLKAIETVFWPVRK